MKLRVTTAIDRVIEDAMEKHMVAGHWPEVHFQKAAMRSFLLIPFMEVAKMYQRTAHEWLKANVDEQLGLWTRKRGEPMLRQLADILEMPPVESGDVAVGATVLLSEIPDISNKYREATVDMCHSTAYPMIMEGVVKEENGYFGEHGSWFHAELRMLKVDGVWRPIEITQEEKEICFA